MTTSDAPQPPGGPQREDAPEGPDTPGEESKDPGPSDPGEGHVPPVTHGEPSASEAEEALQQENAETSLDQPSQ